MLWRRCVFTNMVSGIIFPSHAWGIRPITTHWIAGQSEHTAFFRMMSFVKINMFQKVGERRTTIIYGMWKMCFLNLKLLKFIALHHVHKIMFFLATSYDPFKYFCNLVNTVHFTHIYKTQICIKRQKEHPCNLFQKGCSESPSKQRLIPRGRVLNCDFKNSSLIIHHWYIINLQIKYLPLPSPQTLFSRDSFNTV